MITEINQMTLSLRTYDERDLEQPAPWDTHGWTRNDGTLWVRDYAKFANCIDAASAGKKLRLTFDFYINDVTINKTNTECSLVGTGPPTIEVVGDKL